LATSRMAALEGRRSRPVLSAAIELNTRTTSDTSSRPSRYRIPAACPSSCVRALLRFIIKAFTLLSCTASDLQLCNHPQLSCPVPSCRLQHHSPSPQYPSRLASPHPTVIAHLLSLLSLWNSWLSDTVSHRRGSIQTRFPLSDTEPRCLSRLSTTAIASPPRTSQSIPDNLWSHTIQSLRPQASTCYKHDFFLSATNPTSSNRNGPNKARSKWHNSRMAASP
jgi:hypothetical protein